MGRLCQKNKKAMKSFDFTAFSGAMEGTRTPGLLIRRGPLYGFSVSGCCYLYRFIVVFVFLRAHSFLFVSVKQGTFKALSREHIIP